ncbi:hypothetical protein ASPWEDRAFT_101556 [Aspergillus wentii DTO 134E9]|uniref:Fringe-like glycosyltransferase domain-containing protein n=1 Tax=Aspergillus wentii DTO 134E9 TaxID=1073089 RepID=A0A1L9S0L5_ASPWE|nr:uncharacterized protein ASPWEDRAFT_101556 [Aspergillus wentii DTO 134E9]KAI9931273.1 hypothetical protein MW887_010935 [Aspergillus wentii]OJJ40714.1 hypothetical protein ASPWEDRAFT_101556 [Aspergillus wentii DTO 134E9]
MLLRVGERPGWGTSWAWKKFVRFGVAFLFITTFALLLWPQINTKHVVVHTAGHNITISSDVKCDNLNFDVLGRLDVRKLSKYMRREIIAVPSSAQGIPITQRVQTPLFDTKKLNAEDTVTVQQQLQADCSNPFPITVHVPTSPKTVDASHIDFGVATTLKRLNESVDQFAHWAGYTKTRIFALVEPDDRVNEVQAKADTLGINLYVTQSDEEYQTRYFSLIAHLAENMREQTRWSVVIDDDTFFLSMSALVQALGEYDHTKPAYIGGISESVPQVGNFGLMAFGGAGVFLSRPLVLELSSSDIFDACQHMEFTGDRRISLCIYQYTTTRLTIDHRLRQLDMMGDVTGFFEAGRELPLSVHHWKSWFHYDMSKVSTISDLCGDNCMLRKWFFNDGWVLTNGFSVVKYSSDIDPDDKTMELTWESHNGAVHESYLHELGPLRPKDWDKVSYLIADSVVEGDTVRQWYINRDPNGDQVLELVWRSG